MHEIKGDFLKDQIENKAFKIYSQNFELDGIKFFSKSQ